MGFAHSIATALFERKSLSRAPDARIVGDHVIISPNRVNRPQRPADWDPTLAIRDGYKKVIYVYRAINSLALAVAKVPVIVSTRRGKTDWEPAPEHKLQKLFDRPNSKQGRRVLMIRTVQGLYLAGNAFAHKVLVSRSETGAPKGDDGKTLQAIKELWPMVPIGWSPVPDPKGFVKEYEYSYDGVNRRVGSDPGPFPAVEILHHRFEDPAKPWWGMSPLQPASGVIDTLVEALNWNRESLENRTSTGGVLVSKQALEAGQYEQVRELVRRDLEGSKNAGRTKIIPADFDWRDNTSTPQEMDFIDGQKMLREDTLSTFGVPPVEAGFFDQATLANAEVSHKMFWESAVVPLCDMLADDYRQGLVPHFGNPDEIFVEFDYDSIPALRDDLGKKMAIFVQATNAGVPYNEANQKLEMGLEEQEEGDTPFGISRPTGQLVSPDAEAVAGAIAATKPAGPAPATGQQLEVTQSTVLNSAQVTAATAVVQAVADGKLPRDSGLGQLQVFYNLSPEQAEQIMGSVGNGFVAPKVPEPAPAAPPQEDKPEVPPAKAFTLAMRHKVSIALSDSDLSVLNDQSGASEAIRKRIEVELRRQLAAATLAVDVDRLAGVIASGGTGEQVASAMGVARLDAGLKEVLPKAIQDAMGAGGERAVRELPGFDFDPKRLRAEAEVYGRRLADQLMDSTRRGIDDLVASFRSGNLKGATQEQLAAVLREAIGANGNQFGSLRATWQKLLDASKDPAKVADKVRKLARGMTRERIAKVADQEAYGAVQRGQLSAWRQAKDAGAVAAVQKTWVNSDDELVDDVCSELDGETVDIEGQFTSAISGQSYSAPPEPHPGCRCGLLLTVYD